MRIRRFLFVLAVLLMAVASQGNACISENSRQGPRSIFQAPRPVIEPPLSFTTAAFLEMESRPAAGVPFVSVFDGADESNEYLRLPPVPMPKFLERFFPELKKPRLNLLREFVSGPGTDDIELVRYHGRNINMLKDALGSTIAITSRDGHAIARIGYDAWGNFRWPDKPGHGVAPCREDDLEGILGRFEGSRMFGMPQHDAWHHGRHFAKVLTPYLYTGRRYDLFTGLYNSRNRYYAPKYGRFTSSDPIGFLGGPNRYGYVKNNPLRYTDPFGLDTKALGIAGPSINADAALGITNAIAENAVSPYGAARDAIRAGSAFSQWNLLEGAGYAAVAAMGIIPGAKALGKAAKAAAGTLERVVIREGAELAETAAKKALTAEVKAVEEASQNLTYLYQKVDATGEHLKYGITKSPATRYTAEELAGGELRILGAGPRKEMLSLERKLHETLPIGPEERQKFYIEIQKAKGLRPPPYE